MRSGAGQVGAVVAVMSLLAGCANFEAASGFAKESAALAASARPEFEVLAGLCAEQAGVHRLLMLNRAGQQGDPLTVQGDCRGYQGASEALVVQSLDVLALYAKTLAALADDHPTDLGDDLASLGSKLSGLKDGAGSAVFDSTRVEAVTALADELAAIATRQERSAGIRQLVAVLPQLQAQLRVLRGYFAVDGGVPPYARYLRYVARVRQANESELDDWIASGREPLRATELKLQSGEVAAHKIAPRLADGSDSLRAAMVSAIDAWLVASERFAQQAFTRDGKQAFSELRSLRKELQTLKRRVDAAQ